MSLRRNMTILVSAVALSAPGMAVFAPAASAATSCYASTCTGLDPAATICQNDAETVSTGAGGITDIELRYSPTCRAAWARIKGSPLQGHITVTNSRGQTYSANVPGSGTGTVYTRMVNDAGITSYACDYSGSGYECTTSF